MHSQRFLVASAAVAGILSAFMPWMRTGLAKESTSGISRADGWIVIALFAIVLTAALAGERKSPLSTAVRGLAIVAGGPVALLAVWNMIETLIASSDARALGLKIGLGFGLFVTLVAGIAMVIAASKPRGE